MTCISRRAGGNVLGNLKFSFPNKHAVYMHDTTTKGLFEEASRPFSHGCVRVRNPDKLAEILLGQDKGWDAAKVDEMIAAPADENPITLDTKVPVHITYFTAWIDAEGNEQGAKDVYGHEQRIRSRSKASSTRSRAGQITWRPSPMPRCARFRQRTRPSAPS